MLKVLIADDEPFIRQGLKCLIDWNQEGFDIAAEADNGQTALELIENRKFDLILTDIKMPKLTGLEVLEEVRRRNLSDAKFVILSGYFEYEYVKTAINSRCADYIIKPVQKDDLIKTLRNVAAEFTEKQIFKKSQSVNDKALLDTHLRSVLWGKYDEEDLKTIAHVMGETVQIRYIGIEANLSDEGYAALSRSDKRKAGKQLAEICETVVSDTKCPVIFDVSKHEASYDIGIIYSSFLAEKEAVTEEDYLKRFEKTVQDAYEFKIILYVGNIVNSLDELSQSFRSAVIAKAVNVFSNDKKADYDDAIESLDKEKLDKLVTAVESNDEAWIERCIDEIYCYINSMDYRLVSLNINYLLYRFIHLAREIDKNVNQDDVMEYICNNTFNIGTLCESSTRFKSFAIDYSRYLLQLRSGNFSGLLADIKKYIDENFMDNISLKSLGEQYYINSAYLGQIFKKQFNISFKDYLNVVRIDEAARRIITGREKIQCIAEEVGYKSMDYFTKKFIALKGVTPTKLRKRANQSAE